jgi:hypothetical protein
VKCSTRCAQFAQEKLSVIEPGNGSEHVAQNGGLMRGAFSAHVLHKYSVLSTGTAQIAQSGG